jgi:hypothetical protein
MNKIYIKPSDGNFPAQTFSIQDDPIIEAVTEFSSFADLAPTISTMVDTLNAASTSSGSVSQGGLSLRTILDAPRWSKTNPIKITTDIFLYTQDNTYENVIVPFHFFEKLHILQKDKNGKVKVPGLNATNVTKVLDSMKKTKVDSSYGVPSLTSLKNAIKNNTFNSIVSVAIPGVVYLPMALIASLSPTFSKHTTKKGYPLWINLNITFQSMTPAFIDNFIDGKNFYYSRRIDKISEGVTAQSVREFENLI